LKTTNEPTRKQILDQLKKTGQLTVNQLTKVLGISPMAIRQHLASFEKQGLVSHTQMRRQIGRPSYIYFLTEKADKMFTKSYDEFLIDILEKIGSGQIPETIEEIFQQRFSKIYKANRDIVSRTHPSDRLTVLLKILNNNGFLASLAQNHSQIFLRAYNCPILKIAKKYPFACEYEVEALNQLLGEELTLTTTQSSGHHFCEFVYKKKI
jgi:predicted ArsR family transcriptional regulator